MTKKPKRTVAVPKELFTEKKPANMLTHERLQELKAEWEIYYENPSMRDIVYKNVQNLTQQILDGEVIVEKSGQDDSVVV